jgi:hypothetical protein
MAGQWNNHVQGTTALKNKTADIEKAQRDRDRWEADLLLNVVIAHIAFSNSPDAVSRKKAYTRFRSMVNQLYQFVIGEPPQGSEPDSEA